MKKYVFICICFPGILFAQQQRVDTSHIYSIPEITVTESYKIQDLRSAIPVQTLSNKQLNLLNALQLSDAVKHFSGATVKDYGGIGGLKTVSIRSLGAEHTAVSYDGVTITDSQSGQIDIGRYSLENIDHLSLSIGQNDNIFQPARLFASAGILNIYTLTPHFKDGSVNQGSASLKTGSWGFINPFFLLEHKIAKRWSATANAEWLSADGRYPFFLHYTNQNDDLSSKEKRHNTEVRNLRLETELFGNFSNNEQFRLKMYYYQSSRGLPGATTYYYNHSSQHQWDKNLFVQSYYQKDINRQWAFMSSAKWNWSYTHYLDPDYLNSEGKTENSYFQREYYLTSSLLFRAFDNLSVSLSSDESINKLNANLSNFAFPTRFTWLSSIAIKYANRHITASSSLLTTLTNEQVKNGSAGNNYHRLSPFASLSYRPFSNEDFTIRAFYKDIFRLPTFNDLYYGAIGYRGLKPEKAKQSNLGITYGKRGLGIISFFSASADAYYNKVREKIIAVPTKNLFIWSMVNLGKVDMKGLDIDGSLSLTPIKDWQMDLSGNYSYLRAIDKTDSNSKTYNQQIAYTPRVSASGQCAIISPWITLSYNFIHSGRRYMLGQNLKENRLNGYNDSSISARKSFKWNKMTCSTAIEVLNIMNKNYEIVKNFPMPGRSFRVTLTIKR